MHKEHIFPRNRQDVVRRNTTERWADSELTDQLGLGDVADVENDHCRTVPHVRGLAVVADNRRPVKRGVQFGLLALFLSRHPPASRFLRILRIADVEKDEDTT